MASWLQRPTPSHQAQIAGTAVLSGLAVAGAIFGIQSLRRQPAVNSLVSTKASSSIDYQIEKVCSISSKQESLHLNADYPSEGS